MEYPKFEQKVREKITEPMRMQNAQPGYALILNYNPKTNTAMVVTSLQGSDQLGEIYKDVPCPVSVGVQVRAPRLGTPCWVSFRDGTSTTPIITSFFNPHFEEYDSHSQNYAQNSLPKFMLTM